MKPFDLKKAISGDPIVTKDGRKARFITHIPECTYGVVVVLEGANVPSAYNEKGLSTFSTEIDAYDLFMATKKRTVYVNFYENGTATHYENIDCAKNIAFNKIAIAVAVPVEIEE